MRNQDQIRVVESQVSKLETRAREVAEALRGDGIPVNDSLRLDPEQYANAEGYVVADIARDQARVQGHTIDSRGPNAAPSDHEVLEMMVSVLFHKYMGDRVIACRSSVVDKVDKKVDNILVDQETGEALCTIDELVEEGAVPGALETHGAKSQKAKAVGANVRGDLDIKYGLVMGAPGKGLVPGRMLAVPELYLTVGTKLLHSAVNVFDSKERANVDREKHFFNLLLTTLLGEIAEMKRARDSNPEVNVKLTRIEKLLREAKLA